MNPPRLYHFRVSHYSEKVRWALDHKGWRHLREAQLPGFHIPRICRLSGQRRLPVLEIDGRVVVGSNHILAEIERLRPEPRLFSEDPVDLARALEIQARFDERVAPDVRRLFWSTYLDRPGSCARMAADGFSPAARFAWRVSAPAWRPLFRRDMGIRPERLEAARTRLADTFDWIEREAAPTGHLVGDRFGVADLAVAAVMSGIVRPPEYPYRLPEPWPPELVELRASLADRAGFRWVLDVYARHRGRTAEIVTPPRRAARSARSSRARRIRTPRGDRRSPARPRPRTERRPR